MSSNLEKIWEIKPEIKDDFINKYPEYSRVVLQLLFNRGITDKKEIESFLSPDYESGTHDPFLFKDMEEAAETVIRHIKNENKITIFGDYDADGVTGTALLYEILTLLKAKVYVYIPDRVSEGYGMNTLAVDETAYMESKLIITVDTGIRNFEEVELAKSHGLDVIITDHHPPPDDKNKYPDCLIINPAMADEIYPFKYLAGVGVAFKLAKALIHKSKLSGDNKKLLEGRLLDLVAVGTVADMVGLRGENRLLVKEGLKVINKTRRIGLIELINVSRINKGGPLNSWNIGFQLGPRLNAAGRMGHANTAFELLTIKDSDRVKLLAARLDAKNTDRQRDTDIIFKEAGMDIDKKNIPNIIICVNPGKDHKSAWNEGIIGLVAGKICEKYYRPALVITKTEFGYKGSGRSIPEFNLAKAIEKCAGVLDKFGGHPLACGFSLSSGNLRKFKKIITKIADESIAGKELSPKITIDNELDLGEISEDMIEELLKFEPFGQENFRPRFLSREVKIVNIMNMGIDGQHIKLMLRSVTSRAIAALGFGQAEKWQGLEVGDEIDIVYYAEMNEFNGRRSAQIKIIDIKLHST